MATSQEAEDFAERVESERESWRQYQRNRKETEVECPECGGEADRATIHGQTSISCHEKDCLHYEVIDE